MDKFIPDMYYKSIFDINYKKLKKMKIKCIAFDLDNTLASYKEDVCLLYTSPSPRDTR